MIYSVRPTAYVCAIWPKAASSLAPDTSAAPYAHCLCLCLLESQSFTDERFYYTLDKGAQPGASFDFYVELAANVSCSSASSLAVGICAVGVLLMHNACPKQCPCSYHSSLYLGFTTGSLLDRQASIQSKRILRPGLGGRGMSSVSAH